MNLRPSHTPGVRDVFRWMITAVIVTAAFAVIGAVISLEVLL